MGKWPVFSAGSDLRYLRLLGVDYLGFGSVDESAVAKRGENYRRGPPAPGLEDGGFGGAVPERSGKSGDRHAAAEDDADDQTRRLPAEFGDSQERQHASAGVVNRPPRTQPAQSIHRRSKLPATS